MRGVLCSNHRAMQVIPAEEQWWITARELLEGLVSEQWLLMKPSAGGAAEKP